MSTPLNTSCLLLPRDLVLDSGKKVSFLSRWQLDAEGAEGGKRGGGGGRGVGGRGGEEKGQNTII